MWQLDWLSDQWVMKIQKSRWRRDAVNCRHGSPLPPTIRKWSENIPETNTGTMCCAGFITCTAASHQGVIKTLWLHFWGAVISSIFVCHLWSLCNSVWLYLSEVVLISACHVSHKYFAILSCTRERNISPYVELFDLLVLQTEKWRDHNRFQSWPKWWINWPTNHQTSSSSIELLLLLLTWFKTKPEIWFESP